MIRLFSKLFSNFQASKLDFLKNQDHVFPMLLFFSFTFSFFDPGEIAAAFSVEVIDWAGV